MNKFIFYYSSQDRRNGDVEREAIVHVAFDQDFEVVKFDVDLNSLPTPFLDGYEVISTFKALNFNNNDTFYTDSNGLEMQKRILNYRSYYNITDKMYSHVNSNITANYYPINSAITIVDEEQHLQLTVSNDRSQGGSSLFPGHVELMQNRRIPCDDGKGVGDFMNETDQYDQGIRTPATYYVQLFNTQQSASFQRMAQQKVADPLQYGFTDSELTFTPTAKIYDSNTLFQGPKYVKNAASNIMDLKYVVQPMAKNKIMVRIQNLNDEFDGVTAGISVDVQDLAQKFWKDVNPSAGLKSVQVTETTVTGNLDVVEREKRRLHWQTVESDSPSLKPVEAVNDDTVVYPQQIRVFVFEYTPATKDIEII